MISSVKMFRLPVVAAALAWAALSTTPAHANSGDIISWENNNWQGQVISIQDGSVSNGGHAMTFPDHGWSNQRFREWATGYGYWYFESLVSIQSTSPNQCLEDNQWSSYSAVDQWNCYYYSQSNMQWDEHRDCDLCSWKLINQGNLQYATAVGGSSWIYFRDNGGSRLPGGHKRSSSSPDPLKLRAEKGQQMGTRTVKITAACAAFTGVAAALGISATNQSADSAVLPAMGKPMIVRSAADVRYPLNSYGYPASKIQVIRQARKIAQEDCLRRLGFAHPVETTDASADTSNDQLLSYLSPAMARSNGYHKTTDRVEAYGPVVVPAQQEIDSQSAAMYGRVQRINGHSVPRGGCAKEADAKISAGAETISVDPFSLSLVAQEKTEKDPRMRKVNSAWSRCMRGSGLPYDAPWDTVPATRPDGLYHTNPTSGELRVATADAQCREKTNVLGFWIAIETSYQEQLIKNHGADLAKADKAMKIWLKNAYSIIAAG